MQRVAAQQVDLLLSVEHLHLPHSLWAIEVQGGARLTILAMYNWRIFSNAMGLRFLVLCTTAFQISLQLCLWKSISKHDKNHPEFDPLYTIRLFRLTDFSSSYLVERFLLLDRICKAQ
jgi:hypothetical protein